MTRIAGRLTVPKKAATDGDERQEKFGKRLARMRKAAGYSQRELAAELGISHRMMAYYEAQTEHPPAALLPRLAQTLKLSADELLGLASNGHKTDEESPPSRRLWERFKKIERLPLRERRELLKVIDVFLERDELKKVVGDSPRNR
jgi:transcriptional regulator with XRE-family HTH domain